MGVIGTLAFAACGSDDEAADTTTAAATVVTVAGSNFPESQVLAEVYAQALENGGIKVNRKDPLGARELYYQALLNNEVQLMPEYTNSLLSHVVKQADANATPTATNVEEQITELKDALPASLTVGAPSSAEDKDVIVCNAGAVEEHSLSTLSDLFAVAGEITLGGPPELEGRSPFGIKGFKDEFGAEFKEFVPLESGLIAESIASDAIDCGSMFSTSSAITTEGLITLEDDKQIVPNEAVLPILRTEVATPAVLAIVDQVSAGLTTDILKSLVVKVEVDKQSPSEVAKAYIASVAEPAQG
jgi:osmoprotectant transport system substrate-binding protein